MVVYSRLPERTEYTVYYSRVQSLAHGVGRAQLGPPLGRSCHAIDGQFLQPKYILEWSDAVNDGGAPSSWEGPYSGGTSIGETTGG